MRNDEASEAVGPVGVATGIGSFPGDDVVEACRIIFGELPDLPHVPELPARGATAWMVARACTLLAELHVDLQPAGWRLVPGEGIDERRARSMFARDLDAVEEIAQEYAGWLKAQVTGPFTLAASVERPRGDKILADHGARRDLAQSLTEGIVAHIAELRRRVPGASIVLQLDEPGLQRVLGGGVPTASGFSRHRAVGTPEVRTTLRELTDAIKAAGATPIVHSCGDEVPIELLAEAGVAGLSFDAAKLARSDYDALSTAVEQGVILYAGVVPSLAPAGQAPSDADVARSVERLWTALGFAADDAATGCVITPACGLAGADPAWARTALATIRQAATNLGAGEE